MEDIVPYLWIFLTLFPFFLSANAVLVTGGAGYIGKQTCKCLTEAGYFPVSYDIREEGDVKWGVQEQGDIADRARLEEVIDKYHPIAVIHLAALKAVGESVSDPAKYYFGNVAGSLILIDVMRKKGIDKMIFSSTATIYGQIEDSILLKETLIPSPINPYGFSKLMIEQMLADFDRAYGTSYVVFRYFNAAGADLDGECGEEGEGVANLIPIALQVLSGKRPYLSILGTDYPTPDGTPVRDYVHVVDIARAHVKGLEYLLEGKPSVTLNIGTGRGYSVKEVITTLEEVSGQKIPQVIAPRRPGDPPYLIADAGLAKEVLGWEPLYSDLKTILESAWKWIHH
ncbi:MAG: UDP-glucose 4-epimerase GalE [Verrucomicrobia bacterium]|nr:UDP-glucose 4-epimerase GalE [Verrucomicrobiota bacterium]